MTVNGSSVDNLEEKLSWVCASPKFIVPCFVVPSVQVKMEERSSSYVFKILLCSHRAPLTCWGKKTLFIQTRAYDSSQDSLAFQVPQHPDQPFVPNKGITDLLRPVFTCSVAQLFGPSVNEAKVWNSIHFPHRPISFAFLHEPGLHYEGSLVFPKRPPCTFL